MVSVLCCIVCDDYFQCTGYASSHVVSHANYSSKWGDSIPDLMRQQRPCLQVLLAKRAGIGAPALGGSTIELLAHAGVPDRSPNSPSVLMLEAAPAGPALAEARSQRPSDTREA